MILPSEELKKFVELLDAPVTDSLMGKGAFDGEDSRYVGMLGMHGTKAANYSVTRETGSISCLSYSATAAVTSFVISTNTGPGLPVCAILKARRIVGAKSAIFFTIKLYFVIGIATPAISIS